MSVTLQNLHNEIHRDAVANAENIGLPHPHKGSDNYEHYYKRHMEAVSHFTAHHPKMHEYMALDKLETKARVEAKRAARGIVISEDDEYKGKGKKIDYGDFKTLKAVNPKLPHARPSTVEHVNANMAHLRKVASNNKKQIEHHDFEHNWAKKFRDTILPKWHSMGYTANKERDIKHAKDSVKFHKDKLDHYTKQHEQTKAQLENHKSLTKITKLPKPTTRKFVTKIDANPAHVVATDLVKDVNYFKRKARLIHLKIDHDVKIAMTDNLYTALSNTEFNNEYKKMYKNHGQYHKMRRVAKHILHLSKNHTVTANEMTPYYTLMSNIYMESANNLKNRNIGEKSAEYEKELAKEMKKHPATKQLKFLQEK